MFYVMCPACHAEVEIPPDAVGPERLDLFNVIRCCECSMAFDYDDEEVIHDDRPSSQFI